LPQLLKAPNVEVNVGALFSYDFDDGYFQSQSPLDYIQHVFIDSIGLLSLWDKAHHCRNRFWRWFELFNDLAALATLV